MAIVAIQFLADTSLSALVAKDPERTINTAEAANSKGFFQANVNGAVTAAADIVVDETITGLGLQLDDEVYDEDGGRATYLPSSFCLLLLSFPTHLCEHV